MTVFISVQIYIAVFYPFKVHLLQRMLSAVFAVTILICICAILLHLLCDPQRPTANMYLLWKNYSYYHLYPISLVNVLYSLTFDFNNGPKCFVDKANPS